MNEYATKLKQILLATEWSQEALASKLGTSFVTLNSWVNGKSDPRPAAKEKIDFIYADIIGVDTVDHATLTLLKKKAESHKYSVKKLISDRTLLERLTTSLTYHSNGTEGSTMTEDDVAAVIYNNQILRSRTATEQREAINHQTALYFILDELATSSATITPGLIKATHLRMMNGIVSDAGFFRNHSVRIRGSHTPLANYLKIPELITNWCNFVNSETTDKISLLAISHAEFERIHPFSDGNGRTGRLLLFSLALKLGLMPPILKKERRFAYYKYLELAQTRDLTDPLEKFIAEAIIDTSTNIETL
ncbi:Fic family protein [Candidatus Saccharibacteria bacterium]|nr:Fic family protein [Candidatus Saccharibacteria bacterium]